jgi:hypothetical protein
MTRNVFISHKKTFKNGGKVNIMRQFSLLEKLSVTQDHNTRVTKNSVNNIDSYGVDGFF